MDNRNDDLQRGLILKALAEVKKIFQRRWFDPHSSFLEVRAFWVPFTIIVAVFLFLCWKTTVDNNLVPSWGWSVKDMYEWFKIPLWVLALLIPVLGLFNANHKSEQAKASMELTRSQNNFANYYKHLEEFSKFAESVNQEYESCVKIQVKELHSKLFPQADSGGYKIFFGAGSIPHAAEELVSLTIKDVQQIKKECLTAETVKPGAGVLRKQADYIHLLKDYFVFENEIPDGVFKNDNEDEALLCEISPYEIGVINKIYVMLRLLDGIVKFDAKSELPHKDFHITYKDAFLAIWNDAGCP